MVMIMVVIIMMIIMTTIVTITMTVIMIMMTIIIVILMFCAFPRSRNFSIQGRARQKHADGSGTTCSHGSECQNEAMVLNPHLLETTQCTEE